MMRRTAIVTILALGLLATPLALADGDSAPSKKGRDGAAALRGEHANKTGNRTHHDNETRGDHSDGNHTHAKPAWVEAFRARMKELHASWHENASKIREACHEAAKPGNNTTKEARLAWAHCIRDGYKAFLDELRAERKEARAEYREHREAARAARDA